MIKLARGPIIGVRVDGEVQAAHHEPAALLALRRMRVAPIRMSAGLFTRTTKPRTLLVYDAVHEDLVSQMVVKVNRRITRYARYDIDRHLDVAFLYPAWALEVVVCRVVVPVKIRDEHFR